MRFLFSFLMITMGFQTGCSLLRKALDPPQVDLKQVRIDQVALTRATLVFELGVYNPNPVDIKVDSIDYKLVLNDKNVADGHFTQPTTLPAQKSAEVSIPVEVEYSRFMGSLLSALQKPEALYQIEGNARVGPFKVPFERKGKVEFGKQ